MRKKSLIRNLVILAILSFSGLFGSFLCEAQKKIKPPVSNQPPPKGPRIIPFSVWGKVLKDGKGVPNIRVKLVRVQKLVSLKQRRVKPAEERTDSNGRYSFSIDPKLEGQEYKLIPKHANFPQGKHFWPREKEFTLTRSMRLDFKFNPPPLKIRAFSKTAKNLFIYRTKMRLHQVLGTHQYKYIETKRGHICKFELDYDYYGKKIRIQPMHMLLGIYCVGFSPKQEQFYLTADRDVHFAYSGPLPDLDVIKVERPRGYIIATIKNIGNLAAGKFYMKISYRQYNKTTGDNPYKESERIIRGLEAGESKEVRLGVSSSSNIHIRRVNIVLDTGKIVVESDENNNT